MAEKHIIRTAVIIVFVFDSTVLHTGNVITIKSDGYKELYLKVTAEGMISQLLQLIPVKLILTVHLTE